MGARTIHQARRTLLDELGFAGEAWQTPPSHPGVGSPLLEAARAQGLPGIVAKRLDRAYEPGVTSDAWVSVDA